MKKYILLSMFFTFFLLVSCYKSENIKDNGLNSSGSITSSGIINNTNSGKILINKNLSLNEKLDLLLTADEVKIILNKNKSGNYLEEMPRVKSYYTQEAFYEFYIFNSIKNSDINECEKILIEDKKQLCKDIYNAQANEKDVINVYLKYNEDENFSKSIYRAIMNIKNKIQTCDNNNIISYLSCKKILNKDYDIEKTFLNYSIFEYSNMYVVKKYYKEISEKWGMDKGFIDLIEKISVGTGTTSTGTTSTGTTNNK